MGRDSIWHDDSNSSRSTDCVRVVDVPGRGQRRGGEGEDEKAGDDDRLGTLGSVADDGWNRCGLHRTGLRGQTPVWSYRELKVGDGAAATKARTATEANLATAISAAEGGTYRCMSTVLGQMATTLHHLVPKTKVVAFPTRGSDKGFVVDLDGVLGLIGRRESFFVLTPEQFKEKGWLLAHWSAAVQVPLEQRVGWLRGGAR